MATSVPHLQASRRARGPPACKLAARLAFAVGEPLRDTVGGPIIGRARVRAIFFWSTDPSPWLSATEASWWLSTHWRHLGPADGCWCRWCAGHRCGACAGRVVDRDIHWWIEGEWAWSWPSVDGGTGGREDALRCDGHNADFQFACENTRIQDVRDSVIVTQMRLHLGLLTGSTG
jgi:hypothetical protein